MLGSAKSISIDYFIRNAGETAFLPQLIIRTSPNVVRFMKIPASCVRPAGGNASELICDLNHEKPLMTGEESKFSIHLDTSGLSGNEFRVYVVTTSTGDEKNDADNEVEDVVTLTEFSTIEVAGRSSMQQVSLEEGLELVNVTHVFEVSGFLKCFIRIKIKFRLHTDSKHRSQQC